MYAIHNIKTKKWLYGTDYRYNPPHQLTSNLQMLTYSSLEDAIRGFNCRKCGKDYRIVILKKVEIKRVIEPIDGEYVIKAGVKE